MHIHCFSQTEKLLESIFSCIMSLLLARKEGRKASFQIQLMICCKEFKLFKGFEDNLEDRQRLGKHAL